MSSRRQRSRKTKSTDGYDKRFVELSSIDPLDRLNEFCDQTSLKSTIYTTLFGNGMLVKCVLFQSIPYGSKNRTKITETSSFVYTTNLSQAKRVIAAKLLASLDLLEMPSERVQSSSSEEDQLNDVVRDFLESCTTPSTVSRLDEVVISLASGNPDVTKVLDTALSIAESSAREDSTREFVRDIRRNVDYSTIDEQILQELDRDTLVGEILRGGVVLEELRDQGDLLMDDPSL